MCKWMSIDCEKTHMWDSLPTLLYLMPHGSHTESQVSSSSQVANEKALLCQNEDISLAAAGDAQEPLPCRVEEPSPTSQLSPCSTAMWHSVTPPHPDGGPPLSQQQPSPAATVSLSAALPVPPPALHWTAVILVGLGTGLTALGVNLAMENLAGLKLVALMGFTSDSQFVVGFLPVDHLNLALLLVAATLCAAIALTAGSTGAGEPVREGWVADVLYSSANGAAVLNTLWKACQLRCQVVLARHLALSAKLMVVPSLRSFQKKDKTAQEDKSLEASVKVVVAQVHTCEQSPGQHGEHVDHPPILREPQTADSQSDCSPSTSGRTDAESAAVISEKDLAVLMWRLESPGGDHADHQWEVIVEKENSAVQYTAKRREPEDSGGLEYLSTTRYADCTAEMLRDFYMDSEHLCEWDTMVRSYRRLGVCPATTVESGHFVKKYPLCSPRDYVLAWRVWEQDPGGGYYCVTKAVEHPQAPRQQKVRRVETYTSMWRIRTVPGTQSAEILVYLQEDNGMPREFAKMAFRRGVWGYVRKTSEELRRYAKNYPRLAVGPTAVSLACTVPPNLVPECPLRPTVTGGMGRRVGSSTSLAALLGIGTSRTDTPLSSSSHSSHTYSHPSSSGHLLRESEGRGFGDCVARREQQSKENGTKFRPLRKLASSILMVGGAVALTHGAAPLGIKVVAACLLPSMMKPHRIAN